MVDQRYFGYQGPTYPVQRSYDLIRVNGKNCAAAYSMPPNSSILLLDNTAPVIWLKTTDGASYPTITGYTISPLVEEPEQQSIDLKRFDERLTRLEEMINDKSDTSSNKQRKQSQQ